jgi:hypothetical protein
MSTNVGSTYTTTGQGSTAGLLTELMKKTNTDVMVALKRKTEEYDLFDDLSDLRIQPSQNEMRLVLDVIYQPDTTAMIPEAGYEAQTSTQAPARGTVQFVQMNVRYAFSTLYQAYQKKGKAGLIQEQTLFQSIKAIEQFARKIGLQTYGFSTGTKAVVAATGSSGTTQNGIQLKNAYGSSLVPGNATADKTYLSFLFRGASGGASSPYGDPIALIRSGSLVEFGNVTASPSVGSGVGFIDAVFNSSITPTTGDLIVNAAAVTDATLTATDQNRWPVGMFDIATSSSLHGLTSANWVAGFSDTTGGRFSYSRVEQGANGVMNNGGVKADRIIWSQGIRRDVISGERGQMVYDSARFNLDGDVGRAGVKDFTSVLVPTGMAWLYNSKSIQKKVLSDKPAEEGGPSIFTLDKAQDRGAYVASFDFVYLRACVNRAGVAYWSSLQEQ